MKKLLSLILACIMLAASLASAIPAYAAEGFSDAGADRWSFDSIDYAVKNGYMNGVGNGKFDPEGALTRAMVATVLWRREGSPAPSALSGFEDIRDGEWYTDAVAWAKETGVVKGLTETTFGPDEFITREQLATMLFRFSSSAPVSVPERADLDPFADGEKVSDWASEPLEWAVQAGLIKGTDGNRLAPDGFATREQFAAIIERYDGSFTLKYNEPVLRSHYVEKEYPLVYGADVYVATDGDDSNPGTLDAPLASFAGAVAKVREIKAAKTDGDIVVAFKAGEYGPLSVELTAEDSGTPEQKIIYCKYGDGDVVFSGGFDFPAESFEQISEDEEALFGSKAAGKIRKTDASAVFASGVDLNSFIMYGRDGLCIEARYPDEYEDGTDNLLIAGQYVSEHVMKIVFTPMANRIAKYGPKAFGTMKIWGYVQWGFCKDLYPVLSFDSETDCLTIGTCITDPGGTVLRDWSGVTGLGIEICVTNVSYELDNEGEYWIDPDTEILYVYSPDGDYFIPSGDLMVKMTDVNDVTLRGLTFKDSAGGFIDASTCHGVTLEFCSFLNTSAVKGVNFSDNLLERPMALTVKECTFENSYGHALYVDGNNEGEHRFDKREDIVFDNNLVRTTNMVYDTYNGIHFRNCAGVTVTHNRFEDCSRGAVSLTGSYDLLVEYNDFDSAMCNSHDGGVIYSDWIYDARDLVIRYNYFGRVPTDGAGQVGIYLDEFSSGYEIYSNLFYYSGNSAVVVTQGRDTLFRDNVVVSDPYGYGVNRISSSRRLIEEHGSVEAAVTEGTWGLSFGPRTWGKFIENCANFPAYRAVIENRWPDMLNIHYDLDNYEDRYFALNQTTVKKGNRYICTNGEEAPEEREYVLKYSTDEDNEAYTKDENPIFVNPTLGDYRIRDGADFPDIHFESIGRY